MANKILCTFLAGPKVEVQGEDRAARYDVRFKDAITGELVYRTNIGAGNWASANPRYFVPWDITVDDGITNPLRVTLELAGKDVLVAFDSKALGDTIAWIPYVDEFRKVRDCRVYVMTHWNDLFRSEYPDLNFLAFDAPGQPAYYAAYRIGTYDNDYTRNRNNWRLIPLQQVASDMLGLPYREIRPRVKQSECPRPIADRYVAISEFSTLRGKLWNHRGGWQALVDHLNAAGYLVMSVSKQPTRLQNVIARNGRTIEETIGNIQHAEFFVGLGSGPTWLAWALDVPVVLISGFSLPVTEMAECVRIHNPNVCTGCYNDHRLAFDRGNWNWCPRGSNYECTTKITPAMVIDAIEPLLHGEPVPVQTQEHGDLTLRFGDVLIHTRDGIGRKGDIDIADEHFRQDIYSLRRLSQLFTPKTMVDVGGHIGCAGALARSVWPDLAITAIEPNCESAALYRRNVPGATVLEYAVGETGNRILVDNPRWSGGGLVVKAGDPYPDVYMVTRAIECLPLHDLVSGPVDLLKLDCEGGEVHVLETMPDELAAEIGCIVGEFHVDWERWRDLVLRRFPEWDILRLLQKNFLAGPPDIVAELRKQLVVDSADTPLGNTVCLAWAAKPTIHVYGSMRADYSVKFDDLKSGRIIYSTKIGPEHWAMADVGSCEQWHVTVAENNVPVFEYPPSVSRPRNRRVLFVTPHCSTGGCPQYLLRSVEELVAAGNAVEVVEYQNLSSKYVVQKNRIKALAPFHSLNGNKAADLNEIVRRFQPDVIHLQEFPESFMLDGVANPLYSRFRKYRIIETSHGDTLQPAQKRYLPDAFAFVSAWHAAKFGQLGIPYEIVEYSLPEHERPDRTTALQKLGLDPGRKHVLNVGLFTPGKNQGEAFGIACLLPDVEFHFVGNQADNFRSYWGPLMAVKPDNCRVWGEREDVDSFYAAMDVFLFTSTKELNPIVVKEALSWKMPVLMRELPTCADQYRDNPLVTFIDGDLRSTAELIASRPQSMAALLGKLYMVVAESDVRQR